MMSVSSVDNETFSPTSATVCSLGGRNEYTPFFVAAQAVIALTAIVGNAVVIYLIKKHSRLHTANNLFVVALAVADLMVGLNIPFYISFYFDVPYKCDRTLCAIRYIIGLYVTLLSVLLLLGVAADRYLSIVHTLKYHSIMRFQMAKRIIVVVYLSVGVLVAAPAHWGLRREDLQECDLLYILSFSYTLLVVITPVGATLVATFAIYICIFRVAWDKLHELSCTPRAAIIHQEAKTAKMMMLILGVHAISLIPYLAVVTFRYMEDEASSVLLSNLKKLIVIFYFGKSALNPIIYGWKNKDLRWAFRRLSTHGSVNNVVAVTPQRGAAILSLLHSAALITRHGLMVTLHLGEVTQGVLPTQRVWSAFKRRVSHGRGTSCGLGDCATCAESSVSFIPLIPMNNAGDRCLRRPPLLLTSTLLEGKTVAKNSDREEERTERGYRAAELVVNEV